MGEQIQKFTKITFLLHIILGAIFTILYWIPETTLPLFGVAYNPGAGAMSMLVGAAAAGLTVSSLFGFFAKEWKEVKIVVINEIVWLIFGLIASMINVSLFDIGGLALVLLVLIILLVLFMLTLLQQEDVIKPIIK